MTIFRVRLDADDLRRIGGVAFTISDGHRAIGANEMVDFLIKNDEGLIRRHPAGVGGDLGVAEQQPLDLTLAATANGRGRNDEGVDRLSRSETGKAWLAQFASEDDVRAQRPSSLMRYCKAFTKIKFTVAKTDGRQERETMLGRKAVIHKRRARAIAGLADPDRPPQPPGRRAGHFPAEMARQMTLTRS